MNEIKNLRFNPLLKALLQIYCSRVHHKNSKGLSDESLYAEYIRLRDSDKLNELFHCEWLESLERLSKNDTQEMHDLGYNPLLKELLYIYCGRAYEENSIDLTEDDLFADYYYLKEKGSLNSLFTSEWQESEERQREQFD